MKSLLVGILLLATSCIAEESFVVQSSNAQKASSGSNIKEDFVYCAADLMQQISELMELLGRLQKELLAGVMDVVEGTNNGAFAKEKKLSGKQKKVDELRAVMSKIDELNSLLKKKSCPLRGD